MKFLLAWKWPSKTETLGERTSHSGEKYMKKHRTASTCSWKSRTELLDVAQLICWKTFSRGGSQHRSYSLRDSQRHWGFCLKPLPQTWHVDKSLTFSELFLFLGFAFFLSAYLKRYLEVRLVCHCVLAVQSTVPLQYNNWMIFSFFKHIDLFPYPCIVLVSSVRFWYQQKLKRFPDSFLKRHRIAILDFSNMAVIYPDFSL